MKNVLILGSGRSGTSMTAGTLAGAGYFMGEQYLQPTPGNPRGYFEGRDVNDINEQLLAQVLPGAPLGRIGRHFFPSRHRPGQRWVARLPVEVQIPCPDSIAKQIGAVTSNVPLCLKDPRFCYTLDAWRPMLPADCVFVCVFRHPAATADSIVRECTERPYLHNLKMNVAKALNVWALMYRHVLEKHRAQGPWLFQHFDQILHGDGLDRLSAFVEAPVDRTFPDKKASRAQQTADVEVATMHVYEQLCELAGYEATTQAAPGN